MVSIIIYCLIILAGVLSGCFFGVKSPVIVFADHVADLFVLCLKWLGIPLVSLSILTTTVNLKDQQELFYLGKRVLKYTLLTTISAASIALILFLLIDPASSMVANFDNLSELSKENFTETASIASNNIFGMLIIGSIVATMVLSFILLALPEQSKQGAKKLLLWLYEKTMLLVNSCLMLMPIAIWAFVALLCIELKNLSITSLILYLSCIVLANLIQAIIVLPIFLKYKNLSVKQTFRGFLPSLMVAFWSKSSAVALPTAIHCATEKLKISPKIAKFSLPLCTTINMNACAAFILITVLFVSMSHGMSFTPLMHGAWILIATVTAIGNAGVPMGCYTLSGVILAYMGAPLYILGLILPFYTLIDMLESAINVWSDACVTHIVDTDLKFESSSR